MIRRFLSCLKSLTRSNQCARTTRTRIHRRQTTCYDPLEPKRLLAFVSGPTTADFSEFQSALVDTNARIQNDTLYLVSQGESNNLLVNMRLGLVTAYQDSVQSHQALSYRFTNTNISRIVLVGNEGVDRVQLLQFDFANLQPGKAWATVDNFAGREIQIFATSVEEISATAYYNDYYVPDAQPKNLVRINGSSGDDLVTMSKPRSQPAAQSINESDPNLNSAYTDGQPDFFPAFESAVYLQPTSTSVSVSGDGYEINVNSFDDLVIRGNGGRDIAELHGTNHADTYRSVANRSLLQTSNWQVRVHDFAWERVNLHNGNDEARITSNRVNTLRQLGTELIGGGRRLTNIEDMSLDLSHRNNDALEMNSQSTDERIRVEALSDSLTSLEFEVEDTLFHWRFTDLEKLDDVGLE